MEVHRARGIDDQRKTVDQIIAWPAVGFMRSPFLRAISRPAFDALCRDATKRQFRWHGWHRRSIDRPQPFQAARAAHQSVPASAGLNTTTPVGKATFGMMMVWAEFGRGMIQERVCAGLARAKSHQDAPDKPGRVRQPRRDIRALFN
jgi:hypothetical protein